jgi:serine/threonine protein kinase
MPDAAPLEPGDPRSLGQYEVVGRLGAGGQGAVYLGRSPSGERVAIKLLHAQYAADPSARARFNREVAAAQKVAAFCTAKVIAADVTGTQPYIVSEYIDGPSLHDVVALHGPRGPEELERLAIGTVTALAAIHQEGIVHRDFKPNNVMLADDGPRVVDFGIARTVNSQESAVTATGMVVGTPGYLAPEQLTGAQLQPTVDIFAWGATMVFAATGRSPFEAETLPVIINRILNDQPDLSALHSPLRELVGRCLDKDPARRPAATQLLLELLSNAGVSPGAAPAKGDLLAQGTQLAAQLPAPPPVHRSVAPPPQSLVPPPQQSTTPPPYTTTPPPYQQQQGYQQSAYPATPPPMHMGGQGGMTPPAYPPTTPPPMAMQQPGPMTQPPMQMGGGMGQPPMQAYPPPQRRSNGPIIAAIGCGALVILVLIIVIVAVVANSGGSSDSTTSAAPPYTYSPSPTDSPTESTGTDTVPSAFNGIWNGTIGKTDGAKDKARFSLFTGLSSGLVSYYNTSGTTICTGLLHVYSATDTKLVLRETILTNKDKCTDGYDTLYADSGSSLRYEWRETLSSTVDWTGTLSKS